jgi:hypothetical protein
MIKANGKTILSNNLFPPQFSFEPDKSLMKFDLRDKRDNSKIEFRLNSHTQQALSGKSINYKNLIPEDIPFQISYDLIPENTKYKGMTARQWIWRNNIKCQNFKYYSHKWTNNSSSNFSNDEAEESFDDKRIANAIYGYIGDGNKISIPEQHNFKKEGEDSYSPIWTTFAHITEVPCVELNNNSFLQVETPSKMKEFFIHHNRIESFDIKCSYFQPRYYPSEDNGNGKGQFEGLINLHTITMTGFLPSVCPAKTFKNCTSLSINCNWTSYITSLQDQAFYNTPNINRLKLRASQIDSGVFDYGEGISGYQNYQKVIFTYAETINGFDQYTLATNNNYTGGMKYTNPETGVIENHQVFCGLRDATWRDTPPQDDTITMDYDSDRDRFRFKSISDNVIGMKIMVKNPFGNLKAGRLWLPSDRNKDRGDTYWDCREDGNFFFLSNDRLYLGHSIDVVDGVSYGPGTHRFEITPITCNGLSANTYVMTRDGVAIENEQPTTPIKKVIYTGGETVCNIDINNGMYHRTLTYQSPQYHLWITFDENIEKKTLMFQLYDSSTKVGSLKTYDFSSSTQTPIRFGNRKVYVLDLKALYPNDTDKLVGSSRKLRIYYNGYYGEYWDLPLNKVLTGTVE